MEERVQLTLAGLRSKKYSNIAQAARDTGVLYNRVKNCVKGRISLTTRLQCNQLLSETDEEGLTIWLRPWDKIRSCAT
jgi:hypothetical protein